jgi:hypothetical protein
MHFVNVKNLPSAVQQALQSVGYHKEDIAVHTAERSSVQSSACFDGQRGFCAVLDMATGQGQTHYGSWGGANPFETRAVDVNENDAPIPMNVCVIKGESGGRGTFARLIVRPDAMPALLPPSQPETSADELRVVQIVRSTKGGPYRQAELAVVPHYDNVITACVVKGWLKRNKVGAVSVTTRGKNLTECFKVEASGQAVSR